MPETSPTIPEPELVRRRPAFWRLPIVPVALAAAVGVVLDRSRAMPIALSLAAAGGCLGTWLLFRRHGSFAKLGIFAASMFLMAAAHRLSQDPPANRQLRDLATADGTPLRLIATLVAPVQLSPGNEDVLRTMSRPETARLVLDVIGSPRRGRRSTAFGPNRRVFAGDGHGSLSGRRDRHPGKADASAEPGQSGGGRSRPGPARPGHRRGARRAEDRRLGPAATARLGREPGRLARTLAAALHCDAEGTARRASAARDRALARRRVGAGRGGVGQVPAQRRRPCPRDLRPAPRRPGGVPDDAAARTAGLAARLDDRDRGDPRRLRAPGRRPGPRDAGRVGRFGDRPRRPSAATGPARGHGGARLDPRAARESGRRLRDRLPAFVPRRDPPPLGRFAAPDARKPVDPLDARRRSSAKLDVACRCRLAQGTRPARSASFISPMRSSGSG